MPRARCLLAVFLLGSPIVLAQGFFVGDPAAGPASMAASWVAYPEDQTIVIFNPAGIVRVKDGLAGNATLVHFTTGKYTRLPDDKNNFQKYGAEELDKPTFLGAPMLAAVDNLGLDRWKFGLSSNLQFGSKLDFDENGVQRYMMKKVDLHVLDQNFTAAYAIDDHWSVGGALVYAVAVVKEDVDLDLASLLDPNVQPSELPENRLPTTVSLDDNAFGGNFGVLYDSDKVKAGFMYQTPVTLKLKGDVTTDLAAIPQALKDLLGVSGNELVLKASMELKLPQYVRAGVAFHPADHLWISTELFWIDWSTLEAFDVHLAPNPINVTSYVIPRHWDDGIAFKIGADYKWNDRNRFRAGTFYVDAPTKRQYIQLDIPDNNRYGLCLGWSHDFKGPFSLDLAYVHQFLKDWHIEDSLQNPKVNGDIKVNFGSLLATVRYNF
ncbi:MAG: outer membrane protein transport protein [Acidobacteriota bacterium]